MNRILRGKQLGDLAEYRVTTTLLERGLDVLQPIGDRLPYDVSVSWYRRNIRLQVRTAFPRRGYYCLLAVRPSDRQILQPHDCDFVVAHVAELGINYVIPILAVTAKEITFRPGNPDQKYEKFRDAWHLVEALLGTRDEAMQAFTFETAPGDALAPI